MACGFCRRWQDARRRLGHLLRESQPMAGDSNHWITLHETDNVAGFNPVLVMDVWEHAFLLDYKPSERSKYIEAFFSNIAWNICDQRLKVKPAGADNRGILKTAI